MSANFAKPLTFRFIDVEADVRLELSNDADHALKSVEILTVFLKDLGLLEALSTNRGNGIASMARKVREIAALHQNA